MQFMFTTGFDSLNTEGVSSLWCECVIEEVRFLDGATSTIIVSI